MTNESAPTAMSTEDVNAIFHSLWRLKWQHEKTMNSDELAELLIGAVISHGFDGGSRITGALAKLDMNKRHAGIILSRHLGRAWQRGEDGRYSLMD